jgi:undecaprenyl-diphosphatase
MRQRIQSLDDNTAEFAQKVRQSSFLRRPAILLAHSGDSWFWLAGLGLLWWLGSGYWQEFALIMIIGIAATAIVVMVIKFTIRRGRPQGEWGRIYRSTDPHSFPSGHAARSVMLAVVALGLGSLWLGMILLVWSPLVGLARVIMGVHYPSDVIAGMLLGLLMGVLTLNISPYLLSAI